MVRDNFDSQTYVEAGILKNKLSNMTVLNERFACGAGMNKQ